MAAESCYIGPTVIIDPKFCAPMEVDLLMVRKLASLTEGDIQATDVNGNTVFRVKGASSGQHVRCVLQDKASHPIVCLQQKVITAHKRWQVFKGDDSDHWDLLFSVRKSSLILKSRTDLDVYLAANTKEHTWDFKIKGSWSEGSCAIYSEHSSTPIAQMHKQPPGTHTVIAGDTCSVIVHPKVDYAFVFALTVIMEEMNDDKFDCNTQDLTLTQCIPRPWSICEHLCLVNDPLPVADNFSI